MSMINWKACKQYTLDYAERTRSKKFERVSSQVKDELEFVVRKWIRQFVDSHPSTGKTLMIRSRKRGE